MSMANEPPPTLVISPQDLADARVDEVLQQQLSFGMAPSREAADAHAKTAFLYRPWVAYGLAGVLGGAIGWGAIEPVFDDGVRFEGRVESADLATAETGEPYAVLAVAGQSVIVSQQAELDRDGRRITLADVRVGESVEVQGDSVDAGDGPFIVVDRVRVLREPVAEGQVSLHALAIRGRVIGLATFPTIAAFVGLLVGAADGLVCRAWRRGVTGGIAGLGMGLAMGLFLGVIAEVIYGLGSQVSSSLRTPSGDLTTAGLMVQMVVRGMAWAVAGASMGLGQGVALRSRKLTINGLLGGTVGGLLGGLLFDPLDLLLHGGHFGSDAFLSRLAGFSVIGAAVGLMIGLVELLARESWLKVLTGPLAGKEFVIYKNPTLIGSSPKSDIYLFKDAAVEPTHATIHTLGESYELEDAKTSAGTYVNGRQVRRVALRNGDQVRISQTLLHFTVRDS